MVVVSFKTTVPTAQDERPRGVRRGKAAAFPATHALTTFPAMLGFAIKSSKLASCHLKLTTNARWL